MIWHKKYLDWVKSKFMILSHLIRVETEMTICQCEALVYPDQKVTTDLSRNLDGAKNQTSLRRPDVVLGRIVIAERIIKVAQILDGHMVQMTKMKTQLLVVDDSVLDSLDQMMTTTWDQEIVSQCMKMMKQKHTNP